MSLPMRSHEPVTFLSAAFRRGAFSLKKAFSMGVKSKLDGGRTIISAPAAAIISCAPGRLWVTGVPLPRCSVRPDL